MFSKEYSNKTLLTTSIAALIAFSGNQALADGHAGKKADGLVQQAEAITPEPIIYTDPDTGEVIEITKLPSDMTAEEMATYSVEDLDRLKSIEEMIKAQVEEKLKGQIPTIN